MNNINSIKIILIISIILFIISLTQKTYCLDANCGYIGFSDLLFGWLGVLYEKEGSYAWLANPFLLLTWIFIFKNPKIALVLSIIAFSFAFSFYFQKEMVKNEAGIIGKITHYKMGYWLWISSILIIILGNIVSIYETK